MQTIKTHTVGIIMNGVTGRMGMNQHLLRSVAAIIAQGGVKLNDTERIMPDPVLVGRNAEKLESLAARSGIATWTTDVPSVLADPRYSVYFDAQTTNLRVASVRAAIDAGKHIYCEKPTALTTATPTTSIAGPDRRGSNMAWCRTNSGFRGSSSSRC